MLIIESINSGQFSANEVIAKLLFKLFLPNDPPNIESYYGLNTSGNPLGSLRC